MTKEEILEFVEKQRESMTAWDKKRDKGLKTPEDVKCFLDIAYSQDADCCQLDVYRPKKAGKKALPVIVSVHGGGWVYGDKKLYSFYCMQLARRGFAVVNYTYRLAPEYKFPAALEDANNVFKWILKNAAEYGLDTNNIFATGDSAGGNYLATYASIYSDANFAMRFPFQVPAKLKLNAIYLNCGMYDFTTSTDDGTKTLAAALFPKDGSKEELLLASPVFHINGKFPPAFLVTAEEDFLQEQVPPLARKMAQHKVEFRYKCYKSGKAKKLGHVFMLNLNSAESAPCIDEQCEFFKAYSC